MLIGMLVVTKCGCICGCGYWCGYGPVYFLHKSNPSIFIIMSHTSLNKLNTVCISVESMCRCVAMCMCPTHPQQTEYCVTSEPVCGHSLLVDNYLILSLKSTSELSNCRPIKYVQYLTIITCLIVQYLVLFTQGKWYCTRRQPRAISFFEGK